MKYECQYMVQAAKQNEKKDEKIQLRCTEFQKNRIQVLADKHSAGNMTEWIISSSTRMPGSKRIGGKNTSVKPKR